MNGRVCSLRPPPFIRHRFALMVRWVREPIAMTCSDRRRQQGSSDTSGCDDAMASAVQCSAGPTHDGVTLNEPMQCACHDDGSMVAWRRRAGRRHRLMRRRRAAPPLSAARLVISPSHHCHMPHPQCPSIASATSHKHARTHSRASIALRLSHSSQCVVAPCAVSVCWQRRFCCWRRWSARRHSICPVSHRAIMQRVRKR